MALSSEQIEEVEAIAGHERAIGDLYAAYALRFPEHGEFWKRLSAEEYAHAEWARKISAHVEEGTIEIVPGRFRNKAIESSVKYLHEWTDEAKNREIKLIYALSVANDIESALIDRKFYEIYETDSDDMIAILQNLIESSRAHREKVVDLLNKVRPQQV